MTQREQFTLVAHCMRLKQMYAAAEVMYLEAAKWARRENIPVAEYTSLYHAWQCHEQAYGTILL